MHRTVPVQVTGAAWDEEARQWRLTGSQRGRATAAAAGAAAGEGGGGQPAPVELGAFRALVLADSLVAIPGDNGYGWV